MPKFFSPRWVAILAVLLVSAQAAGQERSKTYVIRPVIDSFSPERGLPGTQVTITGRAFSPEYTVWLGGIQLKPVELAESKIVVEIPPGALTGRITLKGASFSVESRQVFWVVESKEAPVITGISPTQGAPGTAVRILGRGFSAMINENVVTLNGKPVTVTDATKDKITLTIPLGSEDGYFQVRIKDGPSATGSQKFTVLAALSIEKMVPEAGPPGSRVQLVGKGFSAKPREDTVTLAGTPCRVIQAAPDSLYVETTRQATTGRFSVKLPDGNRAESPMDFQVAYAPKIVNLVPAAGYLGSEFTVSGSNFGTDPALAVVTLGGMPCKVIEVNDTLIRAIVPNNAVSGKVRVSLERRGSDESAKPFEVWAPVSVARMDPVTGTPGTLVTLTGTGFRTKTTDHVVYMGPQKIKVESLGNGTLSFKLPEDAPDGNVNFRVEVIDRGETTVTVPFFVYHAPVITSFEPSRGPAGTKVTVKGQYFDTVITHIRILLNGQLCRITSIVPDQITLLVPNEAKTGPFEVQTVRRGNAASNQKFEVYEPVRITGVLPSAGYEGMAVHIFGSGFEASARGNKVTLNGLPVKIDSVEATKMIVSVPKKATSGKFMIEVAGRGNAESPQPFEVVEKVEVTSFTPAQGIPGALVTIKGKGFLNLNLRAWINNTPIGVRVLGSNEILVQVPAGAETGKFIVAAPRAGRAESLHPFTVEIPLTVSGFEPSWGPAGQKVIIHGTGFKPGKATRVTLGGIEVSVAPLSNDKNLYVIIPPKTQSGPFRVSVEGRGEIESEEEFTVYEQPTAQAGRQPMPPGQAVQNPGQVVQPIQKLPPASAQTSLPPPSPAPVSPTVSQAQPVAPAVPAQPEKYLIKSIDPEKAAVGDQIMVSGSGFGVDQGVVKAWVGNTPATILGVIPDMVMVEVPPGVNRGKIRLQIKDGPVVVSNQVLKISQ